MNPIISVIIPVYNHAATLERSLYSLYKQECRTLLQVIIVNDGSTDNFDEVIKRLQTMPWYKELQPKVMAVEHQGASAARNSGFKEASGSLVLFWDADTIGKPMMIQEMYEALSANPQAAYAYSQYRFGWKKMKSRAFNAAALREHNYIDTTSLIRREFVVPFDEHLKRFQDWDVWLTLMHKGQFGVFIPHVLYQKLVRRRHGISRWLPAFTLKLKLPVKNKAAKEYEAARRIILAKHHLIEPVKK